MPRIETTAIHAGAEVDNDTRALAPPIHLSTTFEHPADVSLLDGYLYQRYANPTQDRLELALSTLEGAKHALFFATGMGAASAVIHTLQSGDRVLLADDTYFAIRSLLQSEASRMGLLVELVDMTSLAAVERALAKPAKMVWLETPSNPLMKVTDVQQVAALARKNGATTFVDATFCTPMLMRPLLVGADIVMHSTTKYISGHSDTMGGALLLNDTSWFERLFTIRKLLGATASPFNAYMTLRGLRTLPSRMTWHCQSAALVAAFLEGHAAVARVHYPGLSSHPQHEVARRQMSSFGGMLSFEVKGTRADAIAVAARLKLFINATSLGSVESLVEHRESTEGPTSTTPDTLLRLSVGLEHADDLIDDLRQALSN